MDIKQLESLNSNIRPFKNLPLILKLSNLIKSGLWMKFYTKTYIEDAKVEALKDIIWDWDAKNQTRIRFLARFCMYCDDTDDIRESYKKYFNLTGEQRKPRTLDNFILCYGNKEGKKRYEEYWDKYSHTRSLNGYVEKYGEEEGNKKWDEYLSTLSKSQYKRYEKTSNYDKRCKSPWCIEYWLEKGFTDKKAEELKENFMSMCQKKGTEAYKRNKEKNPEAYKYNKHNQLGYWLKRGYSKEESEKLRLEAAKKSIISKDKFIEKYGEEEGNKKWNSLLDKRRNSMLAKFSEFDDAIKVRSVASKESLKIFLPLYKIVIKRFKISEKDIYIGTNFSKEFWLAGGTTFYYAYDFTIRSKSIIIEFNGERWHPNPVWKITDRQRWDNWKTPYKKNVLSVDEKYAIDMEKIKKAEENGFKVLVLWGEEGIRKNIKKAITFLKENIVE